MPKNQILENIKIEKLIFGGSGLATAPDGRRIIISGGAIPEAIVDIRITKVKKNHFEGQIYRTVKRSSLEQDIPKNWQLYGGCKWLLIPYEKQLEIKWNQIKEAFHVLSEQTKETTFHPIIASPEQIAYRNKVEFSWGKYISEREGIHDDYRFGFHLQGQFDRIENCRFCVLADDETNAIFRDIDVFARESALPTYDPKTGEGFWRHLVVRKTKHTNECMLIWSVNTAYSGFTKQEKQRIVDFTETLAKKYPVIHSVYILENTGRADIVTGNTLCIYGKESISEILLGKSFEIQPKSFFQTNSLGAERLYTRTLEMCPEKGEILLDLYAGTGTIGILLSDRFQKVYSVELVESSSHDGEKNAIRNNVKNIEFINKKTEDFLPEFLDIPESKKDITLVVDPPRDGIHPDACRDILKFLANTIVYVSCNPATLVRDLQILLGVSFHHPKEGNTQDPEDEALDSPPTGDKLTQDDGTKTNQPQYRITDITPVDMFPHTHHIETVVRLEKI